MPNIIIAMLLMISGVVALYEGDNCRILQTDHSWQKGVCRDIGDCSFARKLLQQGKKPQICGYNRYSALVCCPINALLTKAEKYCLKYHKIPVMTCPPGACCAAVSVPAEPREFQHMAAIGYDNKKNITWACGGSLISRRFVLTAAHCIRHRNFGIARWVRLGDLDLKLTTDDAQPQDYTIANITIHPDYHPPSLYNDIALVKLKKSVQFDFYNVRPACLQVDRSLPTSELTITGWGSTEYLGEPNDHLMKATVYTIDHAYCAARYAQASSTTLRDGILYTTQICAGHKSGADACPGDSGGPLHYVEKKVYDTFVYPHFVVVGVVSFGKACGLEDSCGVYTRVSAYVPWIESVVWPTHI